MIWQDLQRETAAKLSGNSALANERPFIYVDSKLQQMHCIHIDEGKNRSFTVSTAANGIGNQQDSFKTPFGIHCIRQKIGGGQPRGMIFQGREPLGKTAHSLDTRNKDEITSRVLWLDGLEAGVNHGGIHDTFARYIYIHGTSDEQRIGQAVSAGCIRMKNDDVIELFDEVLVDDIVLIR